MFRVYLQATSHTAPTQEGGGNGRVTETMTITKTVTLTETDTETHSGPWLCSRTLYSQEGGGVDKRLLAYGG